MRLLWELFYAFFKIGAFTFGGGFAMLPLIQYEVCDKKNWVKEEEIADIIALSQSIPGAVAINASTFIGYRLRGVKGAIIATLGIVLPSFLIILSLASFLIKYSDNLILEKVFYGIRAVVVALILSAVFKLRKSCIKDQYTLIIAILAFVLLIVFNIHPIIAIIFGGMVGIVLYNKLILKQNKEGGN